MINSKFLTTLFSFLFLLSITISCKKSPNEQAKNSDLKTSTEDISITKTDIDNLRYTDYVLSESSKSIITDWAKFFELETQIEVLKNGDLTFFIDNNTALVGLLEDFKNDLPAAINDNTIVVRLKVIESLFYRLEDLINYNPPKQEIIDIIKDILIAQSNLIDQINKKVEKDEQIINNPF